MAKVTFTKLGLKVNQDIKTIEYNDQVIEIKQYLPIQEKLQLIGRVIEFAHEQDQNYSNPVKVKVITLLEIIFTYTNISFTEKQKEDMAKLYDMFQNSGLLNLIFSNIPENEIVVLEEGIDATIESIYKYQNSVLGVLDIIKGQQNELNFNIDEITKAMDNPELMNLVKTFLPETTLEQNN